MAEGKRYVVGIDGGGTGTAALLVGLDGTVYASLEGGPSNLQITGVKDSAQVLFELIRECCRSVQITGESLQSIVVGLAGAGRPADRSELLNTLLSVSQKHKFPLKAVTVETDARIALEAAFAGEPGIVLIAGTGSIALYRTADGKMLRAGGWGRILGDEGSGYAVARAALNAVLRQHDGRSDKTILTQKALAHFGVATPEELIPKVYHERADISGFTPMVLDAAAERDRIAGMILLDQARELADLVRTLTVMSPPRRKLPVAMMGGLIETDNPYSKLVREKIAKSLPQVVLQKPKFPAAFGAAIIGLNAFK